MIKNISVGIDIGSTTTRVIVAEYIKGKNYPNIIGIGESESQGVRHGYIISINEALSSLKKAIAIAEKNSGVKIRKAFLNIGGATVKAEISSGSTIVSKADNEVTILDITKAIDECENNLNLNNKKIIQTFPISFKLDGKEITGRVEGNIGNKLEIKTLFATCSYQHYEDLITVVKTAGIDIIDIIANPIASENIVLTKKQKIVGCLLVNIGSETTSIAVFENEKVISLYTYNIGGSDITNDIALGFKISIEEAEEIKIGNIPENISRKRVNEIIEARLSDIFELIENHLKKIKRNELLPGGIIWIGGGANTEGLLELSKQFLKLPSKIGTTEFFGNNKTKLKNSIYFTSIGLIFSNKEKNYNETSINLFFKDISNIIKSNLKQFKP